MGFNVTFAITICAHVLGFELHKRIKMLFNTPIIFDLPDADITYIPGFFNTVLANHYFQSLLKTTPWQQDDITIFGKTYAQPRLTALFANNTKPYSYSNILMKPHAFNETLLEIKKEVDSLIKPQAFTTCLANLYRDGSDSNGWHADNEKELGTNPIIASVTLGAERVFHLKHRTKKEAKQKITLQHGSVLLMKGTTQTHWLHKIPKTKKYIDQRINLTFRIIT